MASAYFSATVDELVRARAHCSFVDAPSRRGEFTLADAYLVADEIHRRRIDAGATPVGVKLGFTNQAVWADVGLDAPFWSYMYADTVGGSDSVSMSGLVQPRIEPEIVLGLGTDLAPGATRAEAAAAVEWAAIGIEVVHCHYLDWAMTPADALADGGLHGALRFGEKLAVTPELVESLATVAVELECDGRVVESGIGANALGGPLDALRWLLQLSSAPPLRSGTVITTGTLTAAPPGFTGQCWGARASGSLAQEHKISLS